MQVLAGSRFVAVGAPHFAQEAADAEAGRAPARTGGVDVREDAAGRGRRRRRRRRRHRRRRRRRGTTDAATLPAAAPFAEQTPCLFRVLQLESDLLEDADEQFVDVVLDATRRFDEFAVERHGQRLAI